MGRDPEKAGWTFLTNHGHVLVCLADDPTIRARDVAALVGITERSAQGIITDLVEAGYVTRTKDGRRNRYRVHPGRPLRHPLEQHTSIGDILAALDKVPNEEGPEVRPR